MSGNHNSGRRPKPTALRILQGQRGHRPLNLNEPQPRPIAPVCPDWLDPIAKQCWDETVIELEHMGLLASSDQKVLAAFCRAYSRWQIAEMAIDKNGSVFDAVFMDSSGQEHLTPKPRPEVRIAKEQQAAMLSAGSRLGLDPSARSRLKGTAATGGAADADNVLDAL